MHCDNPNCKKECIDLFIGKYKNRKYCSKFCLDKEIEIKNQEEELERQWYAMSYDKKVRLGIENMDEPYKWKERLMLRVLLE